jgi:hypothetical protein
MRSLFAVLALVVLAGCKPAQVTLELDPGFYPSAVAYDPVNDRFFVGSHATGAIAIVRRDGHAVASVRPERASHPVVQLAYEPKVRRLWALTSEAVEAVDTAALPVRRTVITGAAPGARFSDVVADGRGRVYVLDAVAGTILAVDSGRRTLRPVAQLPHGEGDGALLALPDTATLIAARGGELWRVEPGSGRVERIALGAPLPDVSQLVLTGSDAVAYHVAAFRGRANEVVTLHVSTDARRAIADSGTRMRYDTPMHGAFDGREVVVLLGRIRHHPSFGGDGRPNLPPRLATYATGGPARPRLAAAEGAPALVR